MSDVRANVIERLSKKGGFRAKIDAKCCDCLYDSHAEGSWRKQVENCTSPDCPLFPIRTKSRGE